MPNGILPKSQYLRYVEGWVRGRRVAQGGRVQVGGRRRDVVGGGSGIAGEQRDAQEQQIEIE